MPDEMEREAMAREGAGRVERNEFADPELALAREEQQLQAEERARVEAAAAAQPADDAPPPPPDVVP